MFFLLCVTIYLAGLAIFQRLWVARARRAPERSPDVAVLLAATSMAMLGLCVLCSVGMIMSGQLLPGILRTISFIIYHVTVIGPLFLVTVLAALLWRSRRTPQRPLLCWSPSLLIWCALVFGASAIGLWSTQVEPYWLDLHHVEPVQLHATSPLSEELQIAILADLQHDTITTFQHHIVEATMQERPNLILIPGDLYDSHAAEAHIDDFRALLSKLSAPLGVFMVVGDHDRLEVLGEMTRGTQVVLLDDRRTQIELDEQHALEVVGLSSSEREAFDLAMARPPLEQDARPDVHLSRIVLVHRPRHVLYLREEDDVSLVVAGHTHGGQINVPFFGPPVTISPLPRDVAAGGLHQLPHTRLYISRGLGGVQQGVPLIRFNCRPELPILHLR
tara:strand:+ start:32 stop:1198 length:1167 start_codon:yes stop_codon:yes gene_type:complete